MAKILVVEDTDDDLYLITTLLKHAGHEWTVARTGRQAWDAFIEGTFDLVLLDIRLPRPDGRSVLAMMRYAIESEEKPPVRIVAMTAYPDGVDLREDRFDGVIVKPLEPERFAADLEPFLKAS